jgi:hypothetical protein
LRVDVTDQQRRPPGRNRARISARPASGGIGVVYTPREVCEPMVRRALAPLMTGRDRDELLALRVCDPAVGEGAFLIEVVRVIGDALGGTPEARRLVAERCIVGADIDARAVETACRAVEQAVGAAVPALRERLRVGDALELTWPRDLDAVIANPPYVRQERLGAHKQTLRAFASYDGVADLYVYFVELAHRVLRRGGRYCLIVPNKWMTAAYGRPLRQLLARARSVEGIVDFARALPLFGEADAFPCILWGTIGSRTATIAAARMIPAIEPPPCSKLPAGPRASGPHAPSDVRPAGHVSPSANPVACALADHGVPHARARWQAGPWHIDTPTDAALIDRLTRRWPALADVLPERPSRGIVTGCNRAFVIDGATRSRLLDAEPTAAPLIRPLIKGRDVRRWRPAPGDRHVLLVDRGTSLAHLPRVRAHLAAFREALEPRPPSHRGEWPGRKPGPYRWYELQDPVVPLAKAHSPRLFYQDIQTAPACCLDATGELVPDTTVWILPTRDLWLLAVLNSSLYRWYAHRRFPPALNGAVRPKLEYMRGLPIATPTPPLRARIERLVTAQLVAPEAARDRALDDAVADAYELASRERLLVATGN